MNRRISFFALIFLAVPSALGQTVLINDPTIAENETPLPAAERALIERDVWPALSSKFAGEMCEPEFDSASLIRGSFSKPNVNQALVYFQICQTGNGLGIVGLALVENSKVVSVFASDVGWSAGARTLPDINQNGLDEFALYYSGGMHQGAAGTGVDLFEFSGNALRGLGWFQSEGFSEDAPTFGYKAFAKKGKVPVFSRQKFILGNKKKWRPSGKLAIFKPGKNVANFTAVR
jgi:hypothetical protein